MPMNSPSNRSAAAPYSTLKIETRSIDYVPRNERHGKVWHQAPFWFTGNFVLTTLVTGFTGAALGLSLVYAILAIVIGVCLGTFAMAFHANQGPRMGLPQMIQSRAQFGLRGAIVPFIAVVRLDDHPGRGDCRDRPQPPAHRATLADLRDDQCVRGPHSRCRDEPAGRHGSGQRAFFLVGLSDPAFSRCGIPDQLRRLRLGLFALPAP